MNEIVKKRNDDLFISKIDNGLFYVGACFGFYFLYKVFIILWFLYSGNVLDTTEIESLFDKSLYEHSILLDIGIIILITGLIFNKMNSLILFGILAAAFQLNIYGFLDHKVHEILLNTSFFSYLKEQGYTIINPQYTRILTYILLIFMLLGKVFLIKKDKLNSVFCLLIGTSVLLTTFLFHFAAPMGELNYIKNYEQREFEKEAREVNDLNKFCKIKACVRLNKNYEAEFSTSNVPLDFYDKNKYAVDYTRKFFDNGGGFMSAPLAGFNNNNKFDYVLSFFVKTEFGAVWVMDLNKVTPFSRMSELVFLTLTMLAHSIWIFGGLLLLKLHSNKKVYKFRN